jgi:hypothetical protein
MLTPLTAPHEREDALVRSLLAGAAVGVTPGLGDLASPHGWTDRATVGVLSAIVLYALAGLVAAFVTTRLREAERRISLAQAREEVARPRSARGRSAEVGGRVEVDGRPGRGTGVRCWVRAGPGSTLARR